jgi:hypothetical protein
MDSVANLEKEFGGLPEGYRVFLKQHDGARPEENVFKIGEKNSASVERFIAASDIIHIRNSVDGFPGAMLPFARASGGNFVYLDPKSGTIHFWDHEDDSADAKLAESFDEFLATLEKFNLDQVKLKPGQVVKVRVNPNFKPKF